jgi:hypothetical protein
MPGGPPARARRRALGLEQLEVRRREEIARRVAIARENGDSEAHRDLLAGAESLALKCSLQVADHAFGGAAVGAGKEHDELVSAEATDRIEASEATVERPDHQAQSRVPGQMSEAVVEGLESIDVAEERGEAGHRYTTPSYLFTSDGRTISVPGFQPLAAYEVALQNLAPWLKRRPPREPLDFLRSRPGELLAIPELAAATGRRRERVGAQLHEVAADLHHLPAMLGDLWSCGPPHFAPRCPAPAEIPADLARDGPL